VVEWDGRLLDAISMQPLPTTPTKLMAELIVYACMRARSVIAYWEPGLAGKIAPMSQRKGMKIPMIPSKMYPFRNVRKHTVKSKKM
jgi:hypothetical protein